MPALTTAAAVQTHIRDALASRGRWVFLTDTPHGHAAFVALAGYLAHNGVRPDKLFFSAFELNHAPTAARATVSLLTCPKSASPALIARALAHAGMPGRRPPPVAGLVTVSDDAPRLAGYLQEICDGTAFRCDDPLRN